VTPSAAPRRLFATFGSEQQLLAYVRWATLSGSEDKGSKFEQGSSLAGYSGWEHSEELLTDDDEESVVFNPRQVCSEGLLVCVAGFFASKAVPRTQRE
jgi:hypothetical protein